ncbi:MAG: LemA family protein [Candidatus Methanoplasma sp.]|jgi:LemA protein|nr:LemA family protein [Candidatus Methanoplasma sp.]
MSDIGLPLVVVAVIVVLVLVLVVALYNRFVRLRNRVDNAWAQIEVQLQRRFDLIPNLVETVRGYAAHEKSTLENVMAARSAASKATSVNEKTVAQNQITQALRQLFAVAEAYPDLKANTNFLDLQVQLRDSEDRISHMRQSYNDTVMSYNNSIQTFPGVLFAGAFGFGPRTSFDAVGEADSAPKVHF